MNSCADSPTGPKISLSILHIIKQAQNTHGVKYNDYLGYSIHCTRRIKKSRKTLNIKNSTKNQFLFKPFTSSHFTNSRYLELIVFTIERALGRAIPLTRTHGDSRTIFRLRKRLRKAKILANVLRSISREKHAIMDSGTILEIEAYTTWVKGLCNFHVESWSSAFLCFTRAKRIYSILRDKDRLYASYIEEYANMVEEINHQLEICTYKRESGTNDDLCEEIKETDLTEFCTELTNGDSVYKNGANLELNVFGITVELTPEVMEYAGFHCFHELYVKFTGTDLMEYQEIIKVATKFLNKSKNKLKLMKFDELFSLSEDEMNYKQALCIFAYYWKNIYENRRDVIIIKALETDCPTHHYRTGKSRSKLSIPERLFKLYSQIIQRIDRLLSIACTFGLDGGKARVGLELERVIFSALGGVSKLRSMIDKKRHREVFYCCHGNELSGLIARAISGLRSSGDLLIDSPLWTERLEKTSECLSTWVGEAFVGMTADSDMSFYDQTKSILERIDPIVSPHSTHVSTKPMFFDISYQRLEYPSQIRPKTRRDGILGALFNW